jgi:hypothetical protein
VTLRFGIGWPSAVAWLVVAGCALNTRGELAAPPDKDAGAGGLGNADGGPDVHADVSSGAGGAPTGGHAGNAGASPSGGSAGSSAAGGSAGAAGQAGVGGTAGAAGAGGTTAESCTDGKDNDGNGKVDCADAACASSHMCTSDVPAGWSGYYWAREQDFGTAQATPCPAFSGAKRLYVSPADAAECEACACAYSPGNCKVPGLVCSAANTCSPAMILGVQADAALCVPLPLTSNKLYCKLAFEPQVATPGTCGLSGAPDFANHDPFATVIDTCLFSFAGTGCGPGESCTPTPQAPFPDKPCIMAPGEDLSCPNGFSALASGWAAYTDTRGCSPCGCAANNETCTTTYRIKDHPADCGGSETAINSITCTDASGQATASEAGVEYPPETAISAKCVAPSGGGSATGVLGKSEPFTVCCKP